MMTSWAVTLAQPDTLWTRPFDYGGDDYAEQVFPSPDGGFVFSASSWHDVSIDFSLVRTDSDGAEIWSHFYGPPTDNWLSTIVPAVNGGWLMGGFVFPPGSFLPDIFLVRVNDAGDTLWTRTLGEALTSESAQAILPLADGSFIIAGDEDVTQAGMTDIFLMKVDANGDTLWTHVIQQPTIESASCICPLTDGNYLIGGTQLSPQSQSSDFYFMKVSPAGDTLWTRSLGGDGYDVVVDVKPQSNGNAVFAGLTDSFGEGGDIFFAKLNTAGDTIWTHTYGGPNEDHVHTLALTSDGGFAIGGHTDSFGAVNGDVFLVKTNADGVSQWSWTESGPDYESIESIQQMPDGGYIFIGNHSSADFADMFLARLTAGQSANPPAPLPSAFSLYQNYPNPFNSATEISFDLPSPQRVRLQIFDITGRLVVTLLNSDLSPGLHHISVAAASLPSGVYVYRLTTLSYTAQRKMLLLK
jgi:hypothetical protein